MKNIFLLLFVVISCKSYTQSTCQQYTILPLRTFTDVPENQCYYLKDTNNELEAYEGTWKGMWNNKTIYIIFKKIINKYNSALGFNRDYLSGKFKTIDNTGNILFDNTTLAYNQAKIRGSGFQNITDKHLMVYVDSDICGITGDIELTFANAAKTQLNFDYNQDNMVLDTDCYFHGWPQADRPEPLPKGNIVLTKQ